MRRAWRGSPLNGVARKTRTSSRASSLRVHPGANGDHIRVVVLSAELRSIHVVGKRGPSAHHLVCSNLFAIAGAADNNAQRAGVGHYSLSSWDAEDGIVILGVVGLRPVVNDFVPVFGKSLDQMVLQLKPGVVAADVYAHGSTIADPAGADERLPSQPESVRCSARPRGVERLRLMCRLSKLLDTGRKTADNVTAGERGLHSRSR